MNKIKMKLIQFWKQSPENISIAFPGKSIKLFPRTRIQTRKGCGICPTEQSIWNLSILFNLLTFEICKGNTLFSECPWRIHNMQYFQQ